MVRHDAAPNARGKASHQSQCVSHTSEI
jgi:hypothetical protein